MFQRYNTNTMPYTDGLRICLSCWKRVPTYFSRRMLTHRFPNTTSLTCDGTCGARWSSVSVHQSPVNKSSVQQSPVQQRLYSTASQNDELDPSNNPFYKKYEEKLKQLKRDNPDKFESKVVQLKHDKIEAKKPLSSDAESSAAEVPQTPKVPGHNGPKSWPPKSLDEIMKLDLVKDLEPQGIKQLWQEYHLSKDCLFSVLSPEDYDEMMTKALLNPLFLCTLPKGDGFEFYLSQFNGTNIYFTSLGMYQLLKENSPACLTIAHFPELKEDKGLVLMAAEYDDKVLNKNEALNLAKQMTLYYGKHTGDRYTLIRQFNVSPDQFQYTDIVEEYKRNREFLEEVPY